MLALRRKGSRVASDERVLGSGEFIDELVRDVESREREMLRLRRGVKDLHELAREVCEKEGLLEEELRCGSRVKRVAKAGRVFCEVAIRGMGVRRGCGFWG